MARTVNKVILIGRLGSDPDVRFTADGSAVANFNVATNEPVRAADGTWEERPEWHRIVTFGKSAEYCGNYLNKGSLVYIEGKLRTRQWEDAQGAKRYTTEIVARDIQNLASAGERSSQAPNAQQGMRTGSAAPGYGNRPATDELPPPPSGSEPEDDIPF